MTMTKKQVTHKDVAKRAGVSQATVSYVINNGPRPVAPETHARVLKAVEELGYVPNEMARSLRLQRSSTIGLMLPTLTNLTHPEISLGVQRICIEQGYLLLLVNSERDPNLEQEFAIMLRAQRADGVIMLPIQDPTELIRPLQKVGMPLVIMEHDLPEIDCVVISHLEGGQLGTQYLLDLGHRRIGYITRPAGSVAPLSLKREDGYRQRLAQAGIGFDPALVVATSPNQEGGYQAMQQLLALPDPPTAVFTHNDMLAMGALNAAWSAGLAVPEAISIVGYDDTLVSAYLTPPLTTVRFSREEMGRQAALMLLHQIRQEEHLPGRTLKIPVELVVRASTGPPPR